VFAYLQEKGSISAAEMYRTFNMGIGMMAIVAENSVEDMLHQFKAHGEEPFLIGEIRAARGGAGRQVVLEGID
jgi:phosphoribosylformylglycinamidine cyclo-ligase